MNYESEFESDLVELIINRFGIEEDLLYSYLNIRYRIWRINQKKEANNTRDCFLSYLIDDLQIPFKQGSVEYRGQPFYSHFVLENSLCNILDSWHMLSELKTVSTSYGEKVSVKDFIEKEWKKIERYALNKSKPYRKTSQYEIHRLSKLLERLNHVFKITPKPFQKMNHISYPLTHFPSRTLEEKFSAFIQADNHRRKDTHTITEKQLSDYLCMRLALIEDGLRLIGREVVVPNGRIDILAKDSNDRTVLIELKISEDKELFWQTLYYPNAFKEKYQEENVRMIAFIPHYPPHLLTPLKEIPHLEIIQYVPTVSNGKISSLSID